MNRHTTLRDLSKLSSFVTHRKHSLFAIESLLNLRAKAQAKIIALRPTPITRWNE